MPPGRRGLCAARIRGFPASLPRARTRLVPVDRKGRENAADRRRSRRSEQSKAALCWALEEARLRGAAVQAVFAWAIRFAGGMGVVVPQPTVEEEAEEAERMLDSVIAEVGAGAGDVDVERLAVEGGAARVLVETARGADLLVVGSRGHGGFAGLLLGSVSQQCATHAPCPVVIVRSRAVRSPGRSARRRRARLRKSRIVPCGPATMRCSDAASAAGHLARSSAGASGRLRSR